MDKARLIYLLTAFLNKTANKSESAEFAKILHDKNHEEAFNDLLNQHWDEISPAELNEVVVPNYNQILIDIKQHRQPKIKKISRWPKFSIAAAFVLILSSLAFYFYTTSPNKKITPQQAKNIIPGKNGATLTLANGKKISISEALTGNIASEAGIKISKTKDGQLIYEIISSAASENLAEIQYNTLTTSRGEQTQVRLQDGTLVFLNAESSITYPTNFQKSAARKIVMEGEAYFEVAKLTGTNLSANRKNDQLIPFIVNARGQKIEVLGTQFNVNSYADEPTVKTTLIEGSVKVTPMVLKSKSLANQKATDQSAFPFVILKPGEQSIIKNWTIETKFIETDDAIAWKNGLFMFNNEALESIMKKVSRWYNVSVVYKNEEVKRKTFFGTISRFANVADLLNALQKTEAVNFQIIENQIIVNQN